ncbi:MAG: phenylalanine--tRNA ligase beta subunit-related protein [Solirubrobacteraceae bacterium]|jgi:DNA/RNA-binding domain of Phe-tRNA-synthetase-like protein
MEDSPPGLGDAAAEVEPRDGPVADEIREEFPELGLVTLAVDAVPGRSSRGVKQRLRGLSDRFRGSHAVSLRQAPVPWAYRVFYRHIGLDPDADRTPIEAAALERLLRGAFKSQNLVDDALTISLVETGVPIWALDAAAVEGPLMLRLAAAGERLGRAAAAPPVHAGRLVVADERSPLAILFGELAPGHGVTSQTRRMTLFTLRVAGVPRIHVEESLFTCVDILRSG